jgi:hypothetical protein
MSKIDIGALVLVREDNVPRLRWPVATVVDVKPGKDGLVRAVVVKYDGREFVRPIQHLHILEMTPHVETNQEDALDCCASKEAPLATGYDIVVEQDAAIEENSAKKDANAEKSSRFGRTIKAPKRLDL